MPEGESYNVKYWGRRRTRGVSSLVKDGSAHSETATACVASRGKMWTSGPSWVPATAGLAESEWRTTRTRRLVLHTVNTHISQNVINCII